jgi:hypothetical protein
MAPERAVVALAEEETIDARHQADQLTFVRRLMTRTPPLSWWKATIVEVVAVHGNQRPRKRWRAGNV